MPGFHHTRRSFLARAAGAAAACALPAGVVAAAAPVTRGPICVFSKHLQFLEYDAMAETAAEAGFEAVALTVRPGGHVAPEDVEDALPRAVAAVQRAGLHVPMMTTAITDPDDPLTERILRTAGGLGIGAYRMGYLSYDETRTVEAHLDVLAGRMRGLAELNRTYGMHGAYQNHDGTRVGGAVWDIWHLVRDLDPRWIGCQYDIRHATVEGAHAWPVGLRLMERFVHITAIKDFHWEREGGDWRIANVPLGEGMVDFDRYFRLTHGYGIGGPVSVHFEYPMPETQFAGLPLSERVARTKAVMSRDVAWLKDAMARAGYAAP